MKTTWVFACLLLLAAFRIQAEPARIALVIGNSTYEGKVWPDLAAGPLQDARTMRKVLEGSSLHFQVVYREDANLKQMNDALAELRALLKKNPGAVALVFYSGHGAQAQAPGDGKQLENYLIPARSELADESDAQYQAIGQERIETLIRDAGAAAGVIILDACRDHALPSARGPMLKGLTVQVSTSILVMYAAASGRFAYNTPGRTSEFTAALAEEIMRPGSIEQVAYRVRDRVMKATLGKQQPEQLSKLTGALELVALTQYDPRAAERTVWQKAQSLATADAYRMYLAQYPAGEFSTQAQSRITALTRSAPGTVTPSTPTLEPLVQSPVRTSPGTSFRACPECPEMVSISEGNFMMGSPPAEKDRFDDEGPQHAVHIRAFEVAKYPVTRGQWRLYANDTGYRTTDGCHWLDVKQDWLNPGFLQDDTHPVVCVSWQEVQDYILWLNRKSGQNFRLLTEAEYEYVNRAGHQTAYFWGDSDADLVRHASNNGKGTTPVSSFTANPFGLLHTTGNVWSWTQDCYHENYNGAPMDGSAWEAGCDSSARVLRGGSWNYLTRLLRSACRGYGAHGNNVVGARLARTVKGRREPLGR
jgi:formylglycine-generating enzyme required for sulfatase activity